MGARVQQLSVPVELVCQPVLGLNSTPGIRYLVIAVGASAGCPPPLLSKTLLPVKLSCPSDAQLPRPLLIASTPPLLMAMLLSPNRLSLPLPARSASPSLCMLVPLTLLRFILPPAKILTSASACKFIVPSLLRFILLVLYTSSVPSCPSSTQVCPFA